MRHGVLLGVVPVLAVLAPNAARAADTARPADPVVEVIVKTRDGAGVQATAAAATSQSLPVVASPIA
ncbi:MAG: hypothetical protein QOI55_2505, partial [Actinomycetota bacterium]|nr:hypothetical protein [Actinomycetota bacterium]